MDHGYDYKSSEGRCTSGGHASRKEKESGEVVAVAKAFRAITAVVVFAIPLVAGAATVLGYGAYKAYRRITGKL
jgi:hypothetical protein